MGAVHVFRFSRTGEQLGVLDLVDEKRVEEVNGEDSLWVACLGTLEKGDALVMCDGFGRWHEYRVEGTRLARSGSLPLCEADCSASLQELALSYIKDKRPGVSKPTTCDACMSAALDGTRWECGELTVPGTGGVSMYHTTALEAARSVAEEFSGELRASIEVDGTSVSARKVDVVPRLGSYRGKRFEYRKDVLDIEREVGEEEVYTAVWAWGKMVEGGGGRRVGIEGATPDGLGYVHDNSLLGEWGVPGPDGSMGHAFGEYVDEECDDPAALAAAAEAYLASRRSPSVSYTLSVADLAAYGMEWEGTSLGDDVDVVDDGLGIEGTGRVLRIEWRDMEPEETRVTIGGVRDGVDRMLADQVSAWRSVASSAASWDEAASASPSYLQTVLSGINALFAESGSYVYLSDEHGLVCSTVPLDEGMRPSETPASAIQVARGMFRIASSLASDGSFEWSTFGTGGGFAADAIVAGYLRGGANVWNLSTGDLSFEQGTIHSADGSSWWDLSTGEVNLSASSTVGGSTVSSIVSTSASELSAAFTEQTESVRSELDGVAGSVGDVRKDLDQVTGMVRVGSSGGVPYIVLGSSASTLSLRLTNSRLSFLDSGVEVAYVSGQKLYITKAEITGELRLGSYAFVPRANGHLGLEYAG